MESTQYSEDWPFVRRRLMRRARHVYAGLVMALAIFPALPPAVGGIVAQQVPGSIGGTVVDASTLRPVSGAVVNVVGTNQSALTNAVGRFTITGIRAAVGEAVSVRVQFMGFASHTARIPAGSLEARIELEPSAIP